ncbi:variable large family protein [Borrelia crocidurae]|nr:variable large family protein [Borrelia crocidurae]
MKEKKELGEIGRREERREGREKRRILMVMMVVMMVMGCNSGGVKGGEGKVNLEAKNSFLESLVAIGQGFQEIFSGFGSAVGDALGFSVVKSGDNRSKVGEHFKKVGEGLKATKNKLKELSNEISSAKNVDGSTIKVVEDAIRGASEAFDKLIGALTKLTGAAGNTVIGDMANNNNAVGADKDSVNVIIESVKTIIEIAEKFDVKIEKGDAGNAVSNADGGLKALAHNAQAGAGDAAKLANEVSKADPWAMIDKIKNATAVAATNTAPVANSEVGALAASGNGDNSNGSAKTNADLASAVALKAMTKNGKFAQAANNEDGAVKAAAATAVNKVLGILDLIIKRTVGSNLEKVKEAIKGMKYSETNGVDFTKSDTTQATTTTK